MKRQHIMRYPTVALSTGALALVLGSLGCATETASGSTRPTVSVTSTF